MKKPAENSLRVLEGKIIQCRQCRRLVHWREKVGREKVKRFANENYWARPVPGFGDHQARLLLVGLAPAAHGANRTGRMFTGDESGRWLYRALYRAGFANTGESLHRDDGLVLKDCYITASLRCAPPQNKPLPKELATCRPFLIDELGLLQKVEIVVGLGKVGFETAVRAYREAGLISLQKKPVFRHGRVHRLDPFTFIASYHPSQQNTFTGKLIEPMFDAVFRFAKQELSRSSRSSLH